MMIEAPSVERPDVVLVPLGDAAEQRAQAILAELREAGVAADMSYRGNMKKRLGKANDAGARYALILGDDELAKGEAQVKALETGEQRSVALDRLVEAVRA
jgi:histidyl-tRNA synthetase